ncbi:hypothetical protein IWQ49_000766 [Labrenzia sp. EL_126]|nr:hypothetical protein [Labrenzia sp. EL_126]
MSVATRTNVRNVADCGLSVFWVVGLEKQALQRRIDAGTFGPLRSLVKSAANDRKEPNAVNKFCRAASIFLSS